MSSSAPTLDQLIAQSASLGRLLAEHGLTIAAAESCTGGLLASILTDVSGSSAYMLGGVVSYSNLAKMKLLGVQEQTLVAHGAVSAETAAEMARGVRELLGSDIGVSTTGVAGPGGGTAEKPVGLVYLHLSAPETEWGEHHVWPHDRGGNKRASVAAALALARRYLQAPPETRPAQGPVSLDQPVLVEATWRAGEWRPLAVWWQDRRWPIVGWGRRTAREDGITEMLVEAVDQARFELLLDTVASQWRLRRVWRPRRAV